jgi:hypothetical protein
LKAELPPEAVVNTMQLDGFVPKYVGMKRKDAEWKS